MIFRSLLFVLLTGSFGSCSSAYFHTANDVYKTNGTIYLKDGSQKTGAITILLENGVEASSSLLSILPAGGTTEEQLTFSDIQSYKLGNNTFVPRQINLYTAGIKHALFVKRLSEATAKIQLFELQQRRKSSDTGEDRSLYFISVPGFSTTDLIELNSTYLVPGFEKKMSAFVADCPVLAQKIREKQSGYSLGLLTPEFKKLEVIKRIISEYSACPLR